MVNRTASAAIAETISSWLLSILAGSAAFALTLLGFLLLGNLDQQIVGALFIGLFALLVVRMAAERPNSGHARAVAALIERLLAVGRGDLVSPAPAALRKEMPALAAAVDVLFEQVRSSLDNFQTMAMYDPVTSLPNRIHFKREAERILKAGAPGEEAALLFIDLDGFKEVNDRLGHAQGDQVLIMVANRLRVVTKAETESGSLSPPLLARLAGDEFTLLFPNVAGQADAERIAASALDALSQPFRVAGQATQLGASIGVALSPRHGADLTSLMKAADVAMYHGKASGRSRVCLFDAELARAASERAETEQALRRAVAEDEFELVYQPQICVRSGAVMAAEADLRWRDPSGGRRSYETFVELAEQSSLIHEIGDWTIDAAVAAMARWSGAGIDQRLILKARPNQLERPEFFARLEAGLDRSGPPPWRLELELSGGGLVEWSADVIAALSALRERGVTVTIDSFGAGYSNFARIRDLPVDRVKIDRSITAEIDVSETARTIVSAVIHLVHGFGCEALVDGVERSGQFEVLRAIGCDRVQGAFCAEAMNEEDFLAWVEERRPAERVARAS